MIFHTIMCRHLHEQQEMYKLLQWGLATELLSGQHSDAVSCYSRSYRNSLQEVAAKIIVAIPCVSVDGTLTM